MYETPIDYFCWNEMETTRGCKSCACLSFTVKRKTAYSYRGRTYILTVVPAASSHTKHH